MQPFLFGIQSFSSLSPSLSLCLTRSLFPSLLSYSIFFFMSFVRSSTDAFSSVSGQIFSIYH